MRTGKKILTIILTYVPKKKKKIEWIKQNFVLGKYFEIFFFFLIPKSFIILGELILLNEYKGTMYLTKHKNTCRKNIILIHILSVWFIGYGVIFKVNYREYNICIV